MAKFKFCIFLCYLLLVTCTVACGQDKHVYDHKTSNPEVKKINKDAGNAIYDIIITGHRDRSAELIKIENELRHAIELDPDYEMSYINLMECIEATEHVPYPQRPTNLQRLIDVCSLWLKRHHEDTYVTIKRGMYYERNGNIDLAREDYSTVLRNMNEMDLIVKPGMTDVRISSQLAYAGYYFVAGRSDAAKKMINQFMTLYPNNPFVQATYQMVFLHSREEYVFQFKK